MMEKKIVYRIFTIADYEREALYLEKCMLRAGNLGK